MNKMKAIIYHTKGCMKCKLTAHLLNIDIKMVLIDPDGNPKDPIIQYMRKNNMQSAPLVRIYDNNKLIDEWNDFQVNKINKYKERNYGQTI